MLGCFFVCENLKKSLYFILRFDWCGIKCNNYVLNGFFSDINVFFFFRNGFFFKVMFWMLI